MLRRVHSVSDLAIVMERSDFEAARRLRRLAKAVDFSEDDMLD